MLKMLDCPKLRLYGTFLQLQQPAIQSLHNNLAIILLLLSLPDIPHNIAYRNFQINQIIIFLQFPIPIFLFILFIFIARLPINWQKVMITLSDERWVDTRSQDSNEFLIRNCFLNCMENPARFIGLKTTHDHPSLALFTINDRLSQLPLPINLAILGLGEDGHIASIFPGHPINSTSNSLCEVAIPPIAPSIRISLAFSLLASIDHIIVVVTGQNKKKRLEQFIDSQDPQIPFIRLFQQTHSPITIFESN